MSKTRNLQRLVLAIAAFTVIGLGAVTASADTVTFTTSSGAVNNSGSPVSASVTFTVNSAGQLTISLANTIVNQKDVGQNISDLGFHINGLTGSLAGSLANTISVNAGGTTSPGSIGVSAGWILNGTGPDFHLNGLEGAANVPAYTILGQPGPGGIYSNANASIAGNGPHNPFINQTATFTLAIPGLTSVAAISAVTFSFGTQAGDNVPGVTSSPTPRGTPPPPPPGTPELSTVLLLGTGLLGLGGFARRAGLLGVAGVARRRFRKN